jgi:hypothetical protein
LQALKKRTRHPEICGLKSFRKAGIDQSKMMASLIPLAVFGMEAGQGRCRPQLQCERGLLSCNGKRFRKAVNR